MGRCLCWTLLLSAILGCSQTVHSGPMPLSARTQPACSWDVTAETVSREEVMLCQGLQKIWEGLILPILRSRYRLSAVSHRLYWGCTLQAVFKVTFRTTVVLDILISI